MERYFAFTKGSDNMKADEKLSQVIKDIENVIYSDNRVNDRALVRLSDALYILRQAKEDMRRE